MEKKKYITPEMLVRRITPHANILQDSLNTGRETEEKPKAKQGNGFSWDGIQTGGDDDSDEGNW